MFGETGTDQSAQAPYKMEPPTLAPVVEPELISTEITEAPPVTEKPAKKARAKKPTAIETAPLEVKAKYKRADLNKMSKKELLELASKHKLEIKSRATKEELVKTLAKV